MLLNESSFFRQKNNEEKKQLRLTNAIIAIIAYRNSKRDQIAQTTHNLHTSNCEVQSMYINALATFIYSFLTTR